MGEVSVRPARFPDDLEQISALYAEEATWHAEHWPADYQAPDSGPSLKEQLSEAARDPSCCLFVAETGQQLVGLVGGHLRPPPSEGMTRYDGPMVYVGDLVVTATYRRHGVGRQLMQQLEQWARDHDAATVSLHVHDGNSAARALYFREGFRAVHVQMRKDLRT
jgi:GNAT superfamily N-acetyltransferase